MTEQNPTWEDFVPNVSLTQEQQFQEWNGIETRFGEFGEPGFSEMYTHSSFSSLNTIDKTAHLRWTFYRNEEGKLLGIYSSYINQDNIEQAFMIAVHPDYQRQGIGKMLAEHNISRYETETGQKIQWDKTVPKTNSATESGAQFVNKLVKNIYDLEN